jgi:hypothetical protein
MHTLSLKCAQAKQNAAYMSSHHKHMTKMPILFLATSTIKRIMKTLLKGKGGNVSPR